MGSVSSLTSNEALELTEWLVASACGAAFSRKDVCNALKLACNLNFAELPMGVLVLVAVEKLVRKASLGAGLKGKIQIDSVTFDHTSQSAQLRQIADGYSVQIEAAKRELIQPVAVVSMANSCATLVEDLFSSVECPFEIPVAALTVVPTCEFDCCEEC